VGLFGALAVRGAAEAVGATEVRVEERQVVLRFARFERAHIVRALTLAGFRPVAGSNQVRLPLPTGRDGVDTAQRALQAVRPAPVLT
jgi:hypothetical protein